MGMKGNTWDFVVWELLGIFSLVVDTQTYTGDKIVYNNTHTYTQLQRKLTKLNKICIIVLVVILYYSYSYLVLYN